MYVEIKENKLLSWCENPYLDYEYVDIDYSTFDSKKYSVIDGILTDISETQEYQNRVAQKEKEANIAELKQQIKELDEKRVRAVCEPQIKDMESGQTWLEYYTQQIQTLRVQIEEL